MDYTAEHLACARGDRMVIAELSFQLAPGRALILRGPNGSGKTTLLRCLAGLTPPMAGRTSFAPEEVAYAAHADGLKAQMSVEETLHFWAQVFGASQITPAITGFDLAPLMSRRVHTLSAGQKRRLSLSRLVLTGRRLWALDEPTVSLDSRAVAQFAAAVRTHLAGGGAAIIATHIDLGLTGADQLDIAPFRASAQTDTDPFLDEALQ
jgi:heme exporter protein A